MADNMVKIRRNVYLVHTQAGFRKALKKYRHYYEIESKEVHGFPKRYPSLVIFGSQHYGGDFIVNCQCFHISELESIIALEAANRQELIKRRSHEIH